MKKCAIILEAKAIMEGCEAERKEAHDFLWLCDKKWGNDISSQALTTLKKAKWNKMQMLPLTEDLTKLQKYLRTETLKYRNPLLTSPTKSAWHNFSQLLLTGIIYFNEVRQKEFCS